MKKTLLVFITLLLAVSVQAQQRDRLGELDVVCRNEIVTHTSVAPDGTLWMATRCGEIYRADDIHSPWRILKEGSLGGDQGETFENIVAFDRSTAVIVGYMWRNCFKRTATGGQSWDEIKYDSKRGHEWFHPVWRGQGGTMWTGSQNGYLAFSTDSGRTFSVLYNTAFNDKTDIRDIYMLSADSGWIAIREGGLYSTSDNWRTYRYLTTPFRKGVSRVRPWKNYLIVMQGGKSYYTTIGGDGRWQRTPLALSDFEVDTATGMLWALDDNGEVILMEDIDQWKPMGVSALFIIGMHDGRLYCRVNEGVMRVDANGVVDQCPFLTAEKALTKPEKIFKHGDFQWGFDEKSVYLRDRKGWYRVARPLDIAGATPDPDRVDRVVILNYAGENFSVDTAGRVESYIYPQPLADFVKPGLKSMEIMTFSTLGPRVYKETVGFRRDGDRLVEDTRTETREDYDPHLSNGPIKKTTPVAVDSDIRQLSASSIEKALLTLGELYYQYPTPQDFGLADTTLDLHQVYSAGSIYSTNQYGYNILFVNKTGNTLTVWGQISAHVDLGGSTHYPWLLPMTVCWREAQFMTYQPVLWQALREAMPDSMLLREFLDNSTLHPRYSLQSGDLIFLNNNRSDMEKAITASTGEYSHVALVERDSADDLWVIEASPKYGVQRISYKQFEREHLVGFFGGNIDVYRLTVPFDTAMVIARAKSMVGKPYDNAFLPDNDAYYCSELIQVAFGGLFPSQPMNWRDADGNLPEYWIKHFEDLGISVPEGVPGTNPTDMSRSPLLKMLK
ncbi:MAG: hypothetical protein J6X98_06640 [Bacteroidales bacterium]|nr:hypothetical protein [Bacteroidales bacterium]